MIGRVGAGGGAGAGGGGRSRPSDAVAIAGVHPNQNQRRGAGTAAVEEESVPATAAVATGTSGERSGGSASGSVAEVSPTESLLVPSSSFSASTPAPQMLMSTDQVSLSSSVISSSDLPAPANSTDPADPSSDDNCLPQLVRKVAWFRRALVAEKKNAAAQNQRIDALNHQLKDAEDRYREKEKLLLTAQQRNAQLESKLHMMNVEPLPATTQEDNDKSMERILSKAYGSFGSGYDGTSSRRKGGGGGDGAGGGEGFGFRNKVLEDEIKRLMAELSAVQWHHHKFEERSTSDKVQAEQGRIKMRAEIEAANASNRTQQREVSKYKMLCEQLMSDMTELRNEEAQRQLAVQQITDERDQALIQLEKAQGKIEQLTRTVSIRNRELDVMSRRVDDMRIFSDKLAAKLFEYKMRVESLELEIRRFQVLELRDDLPPIQAQISVKKMPATGVLLFHVFTGADEYTQNLSTLRDVYACQPPPPATTVNDPIAEEMMRHHAVARERVSFSTQRASGVGGDSVSSESIQASSATSSSSSSSNSFYPPATSSLSGPSSSSMSNPSGSPDPYSGVIDTAYTQRFVVVCKPKKVFTFESKHRDEIVTTLREFMKLAAEDADATPQGVAAKLIEEDGKVVNELGQFFGHFS